MTKKYDVKTEQAQALEEVEKLMTKTIPLVGEI